MSGPGQLIADLTVNVLIEINTPNRLFTIHVVALVNGPGYQAQIDPFA